MVNTRQISTLVQPDCKRLTKRLFAMSSTDWDKLINGQADSPPPLSFVTDVTSDGGHSRGQRVKRRAYPVYIGSGPKFYTTISLYPVVGLHELDLDHSFGRGQPGCVLAEVINEGGRAEFDLGIPAGKRAYWVAERDDATNSVVSYFIWFENVDATYQWTYSSSRLSLVPCHPDGPAATIDQLQFGSPDGPCRARVKSPDNRHPQVGDPPWFACVQGCCVAGELTRAVQDRLPGHQCTKENGCPATTLRKETGRPRPRPVRHPRSSPSSARSQIEHRSFAARSSASSDGLTRWPDLVVPHVSHHLTRQP